MKRNCTCGEKLKSAEDPSIFLKNLIYIFLFAYAVIAVAAIYFFNGTGDAGDSVQHYLYGKYAPAHPELFFNHWAKPFYVLLISPFAQFGITGAKIFNALASLGTIFFTCKSAEKLNLKNSIFTCVILIFTPLYFILTFSGLTEPLFALIIGIGLYLCQKEKYLGASLLISFLPFVRSEGLIFIGIFALYFFMKRKWKIIPFLLTGHAVYSIAGFFVYHNLFWVFTKIPYASMGSPYGSGPLEHFVVQLLYVTGVPLCILFWLGIISTAWKFFRKKTSVEMHIIIFLGFISFFIAHSLFWYFGICNSMGLKRVLLGVMPLIGIICLEGFNFLTEDFLKTKTLKLILQGLIAGYIIIFPFTSNPAAINWKNDMQLTNDQQAAIQTAEFILKNKGINHRFIFSHPYLSEALQIDCFDKNIKGDIDLAEIGRAKSGDIIIWENWYAVIENRVSKEQLDKNPDLANIYNSKINESGKEIIYAVFEKK